jgi:glycine hydroxymethyltransferase
MALNMSGKWFKATAYHLRADDEQVDYDHMRAQALAHKPKLIIGGGSAYSMKWDWARMREIADEVGALLMTDIAHYAGLIAAGVYPSPVGYAHVITSTTHKTLRGPRGGVIMCNNEELAKKINSAVFPGLQGGPLMHIIAAKAVAFGEALQPEFKDYQRQVLKNAKALAKSLSEQGLRIVSGGTESHLMLVDLRNKNITGKAAEEALGKAHITVNKNAIPNDPEKPFVTSGIRVGSPAMTTRGFGVADADLVGKLIAQVLDAPTDEANLANVRAQVSDLCSKFPVYQQ